MNLIDDEIVHDGDDNEANGSTDNEQDRVEG